MLQALPEKVKSLVAEEKFKGGFLIGLEDEVGWSVKDKDLRTNQLWIRAAVAEYPAEVPSAYFLADVFLYLKQLLGHKLLIRVETDEHENITALATREGAN